jgi:hypothetical protein
MSKSVYKKCSHCSYAGSIGSDPNRTRCPNCGLMKLGQRIPGQICAGCTHEMNPFREEDSCPNCSLLRQVKTKKCFHCGKMHQAIKPAQSGHFYCKKCADLPQSMKNPQGLLDGGACWGLCCGGKKFDPKPAEVACPAPLPKMKKPPGATAHYSVEASQGIVSVLSPGDEPIFGQ